MHQHMHYATHIHIHLLLYKCTLSAYAPSGLCLYPVLCKSTYCAYPHLCVLFDLHAEAQVVLLQGSQSINCEASSVMHTLYVLLCHMQRPCTSTDCASAPVWQSS